MNSISVKRLFLFISVLSLLFIPISQGVTKKIIVKPAQFIAKIGSTSEIEGAVIADKTIVIYGNIDGTAFVRGIDASSAEKWRISLDTGRSEITTAAATDLSGNIWIVGSLSPAPVESISPSPTTTPLNPDGVVVPPITVLRSDLTSIILWQISPEGELLNRYTSDLASPILITSMAIDKNAITFAGSVSTDGGTAGIVINSDFSGNFSKAVIIGKSDTTLDAVVRNSNGSITATGASRETLGGKKVAGIRDGIIVAITSSGKISSVIRSSASKAKRNWNSATQTLFLGGEVITRKKIESAVTKFSAKYIPTWTYRFQSTGPTFTLAGPSRSYSALFVSTSKIAQLSNWNPKQPQVLILIFDSKGIISQGFSASEVKEPIALLYSQDLGLLLLGSSAETVSIFTLTSGQFTHLVRDYL